MSLSFAACPSVDPETGESIPDVFPDRQKLTLQNVGKVGGPVQLKITGTAADQFKIVEEGLIDSLGSGSSGEVFIEFMPTSKGEVDAILEIDDGSPDTDVVKVTLVGTASTMPAQPKIKISYEDKATGEWVDCLESFTGEINNCGPMEWPDTYTDQEKTLKMKVANLGCPTLKVTGIELEPYISGTSVQFFIDKPTVAPSVVTPALLSTADGTQEMELEIRFAPQKDNSGDGNRWALLKVHSNAKTSPESLVSLFGLAAEPSLYTTPSFCNFSDPNDTCAGTKVPTTGNDMKAVFQVTNGGNSPLTVKTIKPRTNSGRFSISAEGNPIDKTIQPGASEPLEILYSDAPLFLTELFDITAESNGQPTNTATVRVTGGVLPCLYTTPDKDLVFSDVTSGSGKKNLEVCNRDTENGMACGTLTISGLRLEQLGQSFKVTNAPAAGTEVAPGQCTNVEIEFTKPVTGGTQAATLLIDTNDPDYAPPSSRTVTLKSEQPNDYIPVAVVEGPGRETGGFSKSYAALSPKRVTLHGEYSYDPISFNPDTSGPVAEYRFFVKVPPGLVYGTDVSLTMPGDLMSDVQNKQITSPQVDLNFLTGKTGFFVVYLMVYDNVGQQSTQSQIEVRLDP